MSTEKPDGGAPIESNVPATATGNSPLRLVLLLSIFGLALIGLLYDYLVARPAQKEAYETVLAVCEGKTPDPNKDGTVTDDEISSILGRQPSEIQSLPNGKMDIYAWRSGLPIKSHKVWVIFSGVNHPLLHGVTTTKPGPADLPPTVSFKEPTAEELENFVPPAPPGAAGGGAKGGPGKGGGKQDDPATDEAEDEAESATETDNTETETTEADNTETEADDSEQEAVAGKTEEDDTESDE